jgi:hypothetical protein
MASAALDQIRQLSDRLTRAEDLVKQGKVHPILNLEGCYFVESQSKQGAGWAVNGECQCPDAQHRANIHHGYCVHRLAVCLVQEAMAPANDVPSTQTPVMLQHLQDEWDVMHRNGRSVTDQLADLGV